MKNKVCPNCDFQNPFDVNVCLCCGFKPRNTCPSCFSWNIDSIKCKDCGKSIDPMVKFGESLRSLNPKNISAEEGLAKIGGALVNMGKEVYQGQFNTAKYRMDPTWMAKVQEHRAKYDTFSLIFGLISFGFIIGFAISITFVFVLGMAINQQLGPILLFIYAIGGGIFLFAITLPKIKRNLKTKYMGIIPAINIAPVSSTPLPNIPFNQPPIINN